MGLRNRTEDIVSDWLILNLPITLARVGGVKRSARMEQEVERFFLIAFSGLLSGSSDSADAMSDNTFLKCKVILPILCRDGIK